MNSVFVRSLDSDEYRESILAAVMLLNSLDSSVIESFYSIASDRDTEYPVDLGVFADQSAIDDGRIIRGLFSLSSWLVEALESEDTGCDIAQEWPAKIAAALELSSEQEQEFGKRMEYIAPYLAGYRRQQLKSAHRDGVLPYYRSVQYTSELRGVTAVRPVEDSREISASSYSPEFMDYVAVASININLDVSEGANLRFQIGKNHLTGLIKRLQIVHRDLEKLEEIAQEKLCQN